MIIQILPGVGFHNKAKSIYLVDYLKKKFPNDTINFFNWKHVSINPPPPPHDIYGWLKKIRDFAIEVILDFDAVAAHAFEIQIPKGDIYIGHSAGSILAIVQGKPAITFGSPYALLSRLESLQTASAIEVQLQALKRTTPIFNIINKNDILALPINNAENYHYKASWNPISAHLDYWSNKEICKKIAEKVEEYGKSLSQNEIKK